MSYLPSHSTTIPAPHCALCRGFVCVFRIRNLSSGYFILFLFAFHINSHLADAFGQPGTRHARWIWSQWMRFLIFHQTLNICADLYLYEYCTDAICTFFLLSESNFSGMKMELRIIPGRNGSNSTARLMCYTFAFAKFIGAYCISDGKIIANTIFVFTDRELAAKTKKYFVRVVVRNLCVDNRMPLKECYISQSVRPAICGESCSHHCSRGDAKCPKRAKRFLLYAKNLLEAG